MLPPAQPYPWTDIAHHWDDWGSPLRPCPEDVGVMESAVREWARPGREGKLDALLLGVTPEIATMDWPPSTSLLAFDKSESMVEVVWPGDVPGKRKASVGNWMSLSLEPSSQDVIVGDGCLALMRYPQGLREVASLLRQFLRPHGLLVVRLFTQAEPHESVDDVWHALHAGAIGSFHALKWRLAMALQTDTPTGVNLDDIWQTWNDAEIDRNQLIAKTGWSAGSLATIDHYHGKPASLTFPILAEYRTVMSEHFEELTYRVGEYELAERCPIVAYRAR